MAYKRGLFWLLTLLAYRSTANAHLQAVTQSMEKEGHDQENVLATVEESSDEEGGMMEVGESAVLEAIASIGAIASVGAHHLGEATDLTAGFVRQSAGDVSNLANAARAQFGYEISQLADMGFDNMEHNLRLLLEFQGNMDQVLRALQGEEEEVNYNESRLSMVSGAASSFSAEEDAAAAAAESGSFADKNWI